MSWGSMLKSASVTNGCMYRVAKIYCRDGGVGRQLKFYDC
jgi:hypothetical protein